MRNDVAMIAADEFITGQLIKSGSFRHELNVIMMNNDDDGGIAIAGVGAENKSKRKIIDDLKHGFLNSADNRENMRNFAQAMAVVKDVVWGMLGKEFDASDENDVMNLRKLSREMALSPAGTDVGKVPPAEHVEGTYFPDEHEKSVKAVTNRAMEIFSLHPILHHKVTDRIKDIISSMAPRQEPAPADESLSM